MIHSKLICLHAASRQSGTLTCRLNLHRGRPLLADCAACEHRAEPSPGASRRGQRRDRHVEWIVVDDGEVPTTCTRHQIYVRRQPARREVSQHENLRAGLERVDPSADAVVIIEDDDAYLPDYLSHMAVLLTRGALVGFGQAMKYNIRSLHYRLFANRGHACLARTAVRMDAVSHFQAAIQRGKRFIDLDLWRNARCSKRVAYTDQHVGIKGMPGRMGIERGHNPAAGWGRLDTRLKVLRRWLGAWAEVYRPFMPADAAPELS